jgi:hypothetical protein
LRFTDPTGNTVEDETKKDKPEPTPIPPSVKPQPGPGPDAPLDPNRDNFAGLKQFAQQSTSLGLSTIPYVGDVKDAQEVITGKDLITGEKLSTGEKAVTTLAAVVPIVSGNFLRKVGKEAIKEGEKVAQVVIGESMEKRVIPFAKEIGAKYYKPTSKIAENWMKNNKRWLLKQIKEGKEIIDIGIDSARTVRSDFYKMEKKVLQKLGYPVTKVTKP